MACHIKQSVYFRLDFRLFFLKLHNLLLRRAGRRAYVQRNPGVAATFAIGGGLCCCDLVGD